MTLLLRACGVQDILLSAEGIPTGTDPNKPVSSLDSEDPHWAEPYIHTAMTLGIIRSQEYPDGFEPDTPITRMEMCNGGPRPVSKTKPLTLPLPNSDSPIPKTFLRRTEATSRKR